VPEALDLEEIKELDKTLDRLEELDEITAVPELTCSTVAEKRPNRKATLIILMVNLCIK